MIIKQGLVSRTINDFNFIDQYGLRNYDNILMPLVLFGCYRRKDFEVVKTHKALLVIRWCGIDSYVVTKETLPLFNKENIQHITPLPKVCEYLNKVGLKCQLIKVTTNLVPKPIVLGDKVYTYLNKNKPEYYGSRIVDELKNK